MRHLLPLILVGALALIAAPTASAIRPQQGKTPGTPEFCRDAARVSGPALSIPGFGDAVAQCLHGQTMNANLKKCLLIVGASAAGLATGQIIYALAARQIAASMVSAGTAGCLVVIFG